MPRRDFLLAGAVTALSLTLALAGDAAKAQTASPAARVSIRIEKFPEVAGTQPRAAA